MTVFDARGLTVSLSALEAWLGGAPSTLGVAPQDLLTELVISALEPVLGEIERLENVPVRDDLQFGDRPMPEVHQLHAWLYAPERRIACALHTPDWQPPQMAGQPPHARRNWDALLHEHFHAYFHSGTSWTTLGAVTMPLRVPFDEPGLKIRPLLALWAPVSSGEHYMSETMTSSVRHGEPHVTGVQVFSASLYVQALLAAGQSTMGHPPF